MNAPIDPGRRVVAVVLPKLLVELCGETKAPLGVLLTDEKTGPPDMERGMLMAVSDDARRYGVRPGQRVDEARRLVARLEVQNVALGVLRWALFRAASYVRPFGKTVALQLGGPSTTEVFDGPFDTVWLEVSPADIARFGDEPGLLDAVGESVRRLHVAHLAIADGPRLAQAIARWGSGPTQHLVVPPGAAGKHAMFPLPVRALPLPPDRWAFLLRVGVLSVGDLARLPEAEAQRRLGPGGPLARGLALGVDPTPLIPLEG